MLKLLVPIILLLSACGKAEEISNPNLTPPIKQQLQAQVERIMPSLSFVMGWLVRLVVILATRLCLQVCTTLL